MGGWNLHDAGPDEGKRHLSEGSSNRLEAGIRGRSGGERHNESTEDDEAAQGTAA